MRRPTALRFALLVGCTFCRPALLADDGAEKRDSPASTPAGLRSRAVPVSAAISEEAIDPAQRVAQFDELDDVAFAVELENVSDKPIKLLDTRRGG